MTLIITETVRYRDTVLRDQNTALIALVVDDEGKLVMFSNGTGSKAKAATVLKQILDELTTPIAHTLELKAEPSAQAS